MSRVSRMVLGLAVATVMALTSSARAEEVAGASPRTSAIEFKLGGYKPLMNSSVDAKKLYDTTFGKHSMLLFELEIDHQLFQSFGSFGVGFSLGYAEIYGAATVASTGLPAEDKTALKVLPLKLLGVYRFDYFAHRANVPLVPFVKAGLVYTPWWVTKGSGVEYADGRRGAGGKWGYQGTVGLSLLLDFFDPRLARDFDTGLGVNHSYLFAEYTYQNVNDFGGTGFDFSSRHVMFGLALEY